MDFQGPSFRYNAQPLRIIDADTLFMRVDVGFRTFVETPLRLLGVNAPERNTAKGKAAIKFVQEWLRGTGTLIVDSAKPGDYGDKYGRYLATVYDRSGRCLNKDLVTAGHAVIFMPQSQADPSDGPPAG